MKFNKNTFPADAVVDLQGDSSTGSDIDVYNTSTLRVSPWTTSPPQDSATTAAGPLIPTRRSTPSPRRTSSLLTLTRANTGGSTTVARASSTATPASGTVKVQPDRLGRHHGYQELQRASRSSSTVSVAYTVGNLAAGRSYQVLRGSSLIGTFTADSAGKIAFSDAPGSTSTVNYTVKPG